MPGVGDLTVGETVEALRCRAGAAPSRSRCTCACSKAYRGLPAGSEILVGYAEGGAAAAQAAGRSRRSRRRDEGPAPSHRDAAPQPPLATPVPPVETGNGGGARHVAHAAAAAGRVHPHAADPGRDKAELLSGQYAFPVLGGARSPTTSAGRAPPPGSTRASTCSPPTARRCSRCTTASLFRVGWNRLGGWRLWLDDGQGNYFYYAHLSAYSDLAQEAREVKAGDVIGYMGDTGDAKGTPFHLHFEMHPDGRLGRAAVRLRVGVAEATPGVGSAVPAPALTTPQTPVAPRLDHARGCRAGVGLRHLAGQRPR